MSSRIFLLLLWVVAVRALVDPPHIDDIEYGFNVLEGRPPAEQRAKGVGSRLFTLSGSQGNGVGNYIQYRQVNDLSVTPICNWDGVANKVSYSTSSETLHSQSSSSSHGYDQETSIGVSVPVEAAELSVQTTVRNALVFGNSKTSQKQLSERKAGYEYTFDATATRILYGIQIDYDAFTTNDLDSNYRAKCEALGSNPSTRDVIGFFQDVGTHGIGRAELGQKCTASVFMEGDSTLSSYNALNEEIRSNEVALLWWTSSTSSTQSDSTSTSSSAEITYTTANKYCIGELKADSSCGEGMQGTGEDRPAIVTWTYKPIWDMAGNGLSGGARTKMREVFESMMEAAVACRRNSCSSRGVCAPNLSIWSSKYGAQNAWGDLGNFFDGSKCFCDDLRTGPTCADTTTIEVGYPPNFPTSYLNDWDGSFWETGVAGGSAAPLCGMEAHHSNHYEDRRFKWATCRLKETRYQWPVETELDKGLFGITAIINSNLYADFDETFTKSCPSGQVLVSVSSTHKNYYEDRSFSFGCYAFPDTTVGECNWTGYENEYDNDVRYECPRGTVLAGMGSSHSNHYEDRRFKFKCCSMKVAASAT